MLSEFNQIKEGPLSGMRQFLTTESALKMMKSDFYFMLTVLFVLEIIFVSWIFGYVEKRLNKEAKVNLKIYDVIDWTTNNYNPYIVQYLKKYQAMKFGQLIKYNMGNIFFKNHAENEAWRLVPDLILLFKKALYKVSGQHLDFNIF